MSSRGAYTNKRRIVTDEDEPEPRKRGEATESVGAQPSKVPQKPVTAAAGGAEHVHGAPPSKELAHCVPLASLVADQRNFSILIRVLDIEELHLLPEEKQPSIKLLLCDQAQDQVSALVFNKSAEKYVGKLSAGKVYVFDNPTVSGSSDKPLHLVLTSVTEFREVDTALVSAPVDRLHSLADVDGAPLNSTISVGAIVHSVGDVRSVNTAFGPRDVKTVLLRGAGAADTPGKPTELTLWGHEADVVGAGDVGSVIHCDNVTVGSYAGKHTLQVKGDAVVMVDHTAAAAASSKPAAK